MSMADGTTVKRRLLWHGIMIFIFGLLAGAAMPGVINPRMAVAAHIGGVLSGMFLVLVGLIWDQIRLPATGSSAATPDQVRCKALVAGPYLCATKYLTEIAPRVS